MENSSADDLLYGDRVVERPPAVEDSERELVRQALEAGAVNESGIALWLPDLRPSTIERIRLALETMESEGSVHRQQPHLADAPVWKLTEAANSSG